MEEDDRNEKIQKLLLGQRARSLEEDQAQVMQAILNSDKPLMHVSALAGTGKSVVLGLLMRLSVVMAKQAGLSEDGVDERVLWLGPSLRSAWQRSWRLCQGSRMSSTS